MAWVECILRLRTPDAYRPACAVKLRDVPWLLLILFSRRTKVNGIEVAVSLGLDSQRAFKETQKALKLIEQYDPPRYYSVRASVRRILVSHLSGGRFLRRHATCCVGADTVLAADELQLAMVIVHEATHAEPGRAGTTEDRLEREELASVEAEIDFASKVPGSDEAVRKLRKLVETRWWTRDNMEKAAVDEMRALGAPEWLVRWASRGRPGEKDSRSKQE